MNPKILNVFLYYLESRFSFIEEWNPAIIDIPAQWKRFVIEALRGGKTMDQDRVDIAIDDIRLDARACTS